MRSKMEHQRIVNMDLLNQFKALESECNVLREENNALKASNARLREALQEIASFPRIFSDEREDCLMVKAMERIAQEALKENEA